MVQISTKTHNKGTQEQVMWHTSTCSSNCVLRIGGKRRIFFAGLVVIYSKRWMFPVRFPCDVTKQLVSCRGSLWAVLSFLALKSPVIITAPPEKHSCVWCGLCVCVWQCADIRPWCKIVAGLPGLFDSGIISCDIAYIREKLAVFWHLAIAV